MKARRLGNFLDVLVDQFGASLKRLMRGDTTVVHDRLLAINGIGPETADSMLLYAGDHTSFVIGRLHQAHLHPPRVARGFGRL